MIKRFMEALVLLVFAVVFVYLLGITIKQEIYLHEVSQETTLTQERLNEAKAINAELKQEKANLEKPEYVEKVAREELGMTKPGEVPYISSENN